MAYVAPLPVTDGKAPLSVGGGGFSFTQRFTASRTLEPTTRKISSINVDEEGDALAKSAHGSDTVGAF